MIVLHFSLVTGAGVLHHDHVFRGVCRATCTKLLLKQVEGFFKKKTKLKNFLLHPASSN